MTECYKLLFDLCLYYTIFGYYLSIAAATPPSVVCFLALAAAIILDSILRSRHIYDRTPPAFRFLPLLLPLLALLSKPALPQALHAVPVWAYLGFSMLTNRVQIEYSDFRSHFSLGMWLLFTMIIGPLFPGRTVDAIITAIPYLVCMMACGVCLLRMLRERRPDGARQGILMAVFILICVLLTIGKTPQLLLKGFGYVYRSVIAPLIFVVGVVIVVAFYGFYLVTAWLLSRARGNEEPLEIDMRSTAEMLGLENQYEAYALDLSWIWKLLAVLGAALLIFIIYLLFRRLLGDRPSTRSASPWKERENGMDSASAARKRHGVFRPHDPRLALRWYYGHFVAECLRRDVPVTKGMTACELANRCGNVFPGADPTALTALYLPARYDPNGQVTSDDVRRASDLWHTLKHSTNPNDYSSLQKKRKKP